MVLIPLPDYTKFSKNSSRFREKYFIHSEKASRTNRGHLGLSAQPLSNSPRSSRQRPNFTPFQRSECHSRLPSGRARGKHRAKNRGGDDRTRTDNPRVANAVLSQLSYIPKIRAPGPQGTLLVGVDRLELSTSSLSGMRSNQLSYTPNSRQILTAHRLDKGSGLIGSPVRTRAPTAPSFITARGFHAHSRTKKQDSYEAKYADIFGQPLSRLR